MVAFDRLSCKLYPRIPVRARRLENPSIHITGYPTFCYDKMKSLDDEISLRLRPYVHTYDACRTYLHVYKFLVIYL